MYNVQQQPVYNPHQQQQQWGNQQGNPQQQQWGNQQSNQQQYIPPTSQINHAQPMSGVMPPPDYESAQYGVVNPDSGLPAKFNPRPRYTDCWAFVLFIAQLAAFIVLSVFAISKIVDDANQPGMDYTQPDSEMLRTVTSISKKYPATFAMAFLGLFIQIAYSVYFMVVVSGCYEMYYDRNTRTTPAKLKVLIFFCFFSFYWTSQVIKNIVHVTVSGVFACYYFLMGSPQGMTKSPTCESFKRACTTSIGSICFGSLIVAVVQTVRAVAQVLRMDGDGFLAFIACLIDCILACLQGLIEYVNIYAYCQVAIYGKAYIPAARDTWRILKDRGVIQIINDNLIGNVWAMGALMSGMLSTLGSYLYIWFATPDFDDNDNLTYVILVMAFVMGFQMLFTVGVVIDSGNATTFVCLAEDPAALARTKPGMNYYSTCVTFNTPIPDPVH
ncbi:putative choline transporter, neither null mutation nor overexpression affects choline transport [Mortierella sp. AD010]|nr:putative choline transporter, neither null mutation nor overexpression affects choline transport [Mortierella sp. AD010]